MIAETDQRLNVLVAYPYLKPDVAAVLRDNTDRTRVVVDSGAFTAFQAGKPIALDDYCRFLESLPFTPWRYFTLDVIGNPAATRANYDEMRRRGFNPVPIFTRGEDPAELEAYYETSDLVGIGGLVGTLGNKGFVNGIMRHVAGRRVHWLGFVNHRYLKAHRPYMADSSSWTMGTRRRFIPIYIGHGFVQQFKRHEFREGLPEAAADRLRLYGIDPATAATKAGWGPDSPLVCDTGMFSFVHMSADVHRNLGTHVFLAMGDAPSVERGLRAFDQLRGTLKGLFE